MGKGSMKDTIKEIKSRIRKEIDKLQSFDALHVTQERLNALWWVLSEIDDIETENKTGLSRKKRMKIERKKELEEELKKLTKELL
jgi:pyruvate/2-oxoacid:ferredoxin oxidoreductase beta subunit